MTTNDHGKKISEVWVPGEGNAYNHRYQSKDGLELELSATHHGDRDEFWIVLKRDGKETGRINPRQVTEISWENVKEHAPLSAGASVDHGVDVETTGEHVNRAADRGCCVSTCSPS